MKKIFLPLFILSLILSGCANFVDDVIIERDDIKTNDMIIVKGTLELSGSVPSEIKEAINSSRSGSTHRSAIPSMPTSSDGAKFIVTAECAGKTPVTKEAEYDVVSKKYLFEIGLSEGSWTITAALKTHFGTPQETIVLKDTATKKLTSDNPVVNLPFYLRPLTEGTGGINLDISYAGTGIDTVEFIPSASCKTEWEKGNGSLTTDSVSATLIKTGLKTGIYDITILFKKGNALVYCTSQSINVFANMTTDSWVSGGGAGPIDASGVFNVTTALTAQFERSTFYVDGTNGNDTTGTGSPYSPLKTVASAVKRLPSGGTVFVSGTTEETAVIEFEGTNDYFIRAKPGEGSASITRKGTQSSIFNITSTNKVTIEDMMIDGKKIEKSMPTDSTGINLAGSLTLKNVDIKDCRNSANNSSPKGAIYISGASGKLTFNGGSIKDCTVSNGNGGAIYCSFGTVTLKDVVVSGNTALEGKGFYGSGNITISGSTKFSSSDEDVNEIFLTDGSSAININGQLTSSGTVAVLVYANSITPLSGKQILTGEIGSAYKKFIYDGPYEVNSEGKLTPAIYVSASNGNDNNTGSQINPFKTLSRALSDYEDSTKIYVEGTQTQQNVVSIADNCSILQWPNEKTSFYPEWNGTTPTAKINTVGQFATIGSAGNLIISGVAISYASNEVKDIDGGCFYNEGTLSLTDVTISGYKTSQDGGCIYNATNGSLTISGGSIYNCSAANGGAIYNMGSIEFTGGTIKTNQASGSGSGIYNNGSLSMSGSALVASSNDVYLCNSKFITVAGAMTRDSNGTEFDFTHPCAKISYAGTITPDETRGLSGTIALLQSEHDKFVYVTSDYNFDENGLFCVPPLYVAGAGAGITGSDVAGNGTSSKPYATLSKALEEVIDGKTIYIAGELSQNSALTIDDKQCNIKQWPSKATAKVKSALVSGTLISITGSKEINFNDIEFDGNNKTRLFSISNAYKVNFTSCTFINGNADSGGAVHAEMTTTGAKYLNFEQCTFTDNTATENGGALYFNDTKNYAYYISLKGCTIEKNTAVNGGALYVNGSSSYCKVTIDGCQLKENTATNGGAVYTKNGTTTLKSDTSSITANTATNGGGVYTDGGTFSQESSSIVKDNSATNGVDLYSNSGTYQFKSAVLGDSLLDADDQEVYIAAGGAILFAGSDDTVSRICGTVKLGYRVIGTTKTYGHINFNSANWSCSKYYSMSRQIHVHLDEYVENVAIVTSAQGGFLDKMCAKIAVADDSTDTEWCVDGNGKLAKRNAGSFKITTFNDIQTKINECKGRELTIDLENNELSFEASNFTASQNPTFLIKISAGTSVRIKNAVFDIKTGLGDIITNGNSLGLFKCESGGEIYFENCEFYSDSSYSNFHLKIYDGEAASSGYGTSASKCTFDSCIIRDIQINDDSLLKTSGNLYVKDTQMNNITVRYGGISVYSGGTCYRRNFTISGCVATQSGSSFIHIVGTGKYVSY